MRLSVRMGHPASCENSRFLVMLGMEERKARAKADSLWNDKG
jgi:hypothetical protein